MFASGRKGDCKGPEGSGLEESEHVRFVVHFSGGVGGQRLDGPLGSLALAFAPRPRGAGAGQSSGFLEMILFRGDCFSQYHGLTVCLSARSAARNDGGFRYRAPADVYTWLSPWFSHRSSAHGPWTGNRAQDSAAPLFRLVPAARPALRG